MPPLKYGHCRFGVDYSAPPHELVSETLADAQNIVPNESGLPTGRSGSVKYNNTSLDSRITSFHEFKDGTTVYTLASYSTKIAYYNTTTSEFVDSIVALTSDKMYQWVNFAGKAIGVNEGSDAPVYWSSTSDYGDLSGSPPTGNTIANWASRLWFGGDATYPARLTGSALLDPTDYTGAAASADDAIQQTVGDSGDPITALFGFFDILLVGKKNSIYKVTGIPATDVTTLSIDPLYSKSDDNVGFTSPWAITQVGNDVIFLDGFDIKRLSGIQEFGDVAYASVIPRFREYLKATVDKDYLQYAHFYNYKKKQQIWCSIPTGASTHFVFVLDYRFYNQTNEFAFYPMSGITVNVFGGLQNGEVTDLYYGDETGLTYQLDVGDNDNGSAIERYATYLIAGGDQVYRKQFLNSETFILPTAATLKMTPYYATDLLDSEQIRSSGNYTTLGENDIISNWSGNGTRFKRIPFLGHGVPGKTLALKWYHNRVAENFVIYPSEIKIKVKSKNIIA